MGRHTQNRQALSIEQYPGKQPESFKPKYKAEAYLSLFNGQTKDISQYEPLLTEEEAIAAFGFHTGALQSVIRLPFKQSLFASGETPKELSESKLFANFLNEDYAENTRRMNNMTIFCFKVPESSDHDGTNGARYYLMGIEQVRQLRDQALYGPSSLPDTSGGVVGLSCGQNLSIGRGDDSWLPNVGWDYPLLKNHDSGMRQGFSAVSRNQLNIGVGEQGQLLVHRFENSAPDVYIGVGRQL